MRYFPEEGAAGGRCEMLWVKPRERPWQRFFLEYNEVRWDELSEEDAWAGYEDVVERIEQLDALSGLAMGDVEAAPIGDGASALRIAIGANGALWLLPVDPHDIETAAVLSVARPMRTQ